MCVQTFCFIMFRGGGKGGEEQGRGGSITFYSKMKGGLFPRRRGGCVCILGPEECVRGGGG